MSHPLIERLQLRPHPEGGAYRETFRSAMPVLHPVTGEGRQALTGIYFLLQKGEFSAWHSVRSDEVWVLLDGGPLELHLIDPEGRHEKRMVTRDWVTGEPTAVVPAGWLQAARPAAGVEFALCACYVAPGFDFADFSLPDWEELAARYPGLEKVMAEFLR